MCLIPMQSFWIRFVIWLTENLLFVILLCCGSRTIKITCIIKDTPFCGTIPTILTLMGTLPTYRFAAGEHDSLQTISVSGRNKEQFDSDRSHPFGDWRWRLWMQNILSFSSLKRIYSVHVPTHSAEDRTENANHSEMGSHMVTGRYKCRMFV